MAIEQALKQRAGEQCELCKSTDNLSIYAVPPKLDDNSDHCLLICSTCQSQISAESERSDTHWRCLNDSMWSPIPAVQVCSFQQLTLLTNQGETWAQDLLDMMYLEEDLKSWAESGLAHLQSSDDDAAIDANGVQLAAGDTVYVIKDLPVKGAGFTVKQGTTVRGISLTANPEHLEGRVNGQKIVLLTKFVKKV